MKNNVLSKVCDCLHTFPIDEMPSLVASKGSPPSVAQADGMLYAMANQSPFVNTGTYPTRTGNAVRLLIDGETAFGRVCEAIEAAQHSVWATITFMWPEFQMPDGRGSALAVLDRAARRGLDIRLIFWRPDEETAHLRRNAFWGGQEHLEILSTHGSAVNIRWDRAQPGSCQHQKTWLIDAGSEPPIAFLGGLNLNPHSMVASGHGGEGQNHDVYLELSGPAVADVHHNFVQRWNEASERQSPDGYWGEAADQDLEFPTRLPDATGTAIVQIQRTTHAGRYRNGHAPVGGRVFNISAGEQTNFLQCCSALRAARRTIYLENQYLEIPEIVTALLGALERGVEVVLLLPLTPDVFTGNVSTERQTFLELRARLAQYENFTLAGIAGLGADNTRKPVWVHSKIMLIDDVWATIGSANLHRFSMFGNSELNAAFFSPEQVRQFRIELFQEHLARDTSALTDVEALRLFQRIATANSERFRQGVHHWEGLVVTADIATYGQSRPLGW